jgi:hypothetical protein
MDLFGLAAAPDLFAGKRSMTGAGGLLLQATKLNISHEMAK